MIFFETEPILSKIRGKGMRPKKEPEQPRRELFHVELEQVIDMQHGGFKVQVQQV